MKIFIPILAIALTLTGCSTISVSQRHDETEDFTRFRTYSWMQEAKIDDTIPFDEPSANRRIKRAVEQELHFKGFRKTSIEEADFLIGYQVALNSRLSANDVATNYDFNNSNTDPKLIGAVQTDSSARELTYIRTYEHGTLILNVAEAKTKELIWWSSAQADVKESDSADVRRKRINKAVNKMLKNFPPK